MYTHKSTKWHCPKTIRKSHYEESLCRLWFRPDESHKQLSSVSFRKKKVLRSTSIWKASWKRWDLELKVNKSIAWGVVRQRWLTWGIGRGCCYIMGAGRAMLGTQETHWGISLYFHGMAQWNLVTRYPDTSDMKGSFARWWEHQS